MHGMHVRPGQLLRQGLARLHHHSQGWPHRPIKTGLPLLFSLPSLTLSLSFTFSLALPLPILTKHAHTFLFSHFAPLIALDSEKNEERGMTLGERDGEEERKLEGKRVIPQTLWSQDSLSCNPPPQPPPTPSPNSKNSIDQHVSARDSNILQHPNESLQEQIQDVTYHPVRFLRQLQQSWSIKGGLYFCSAPQNYLIVDFQSTRSSEEGSFPNYVIAESEVSSLKSRFLCILTLTQSFLLDQTCLTWCLYCKCWCEHELISTLACIGHGVGHLWCSTISCLRQHAIKRSKMTTKA